MAFPIWLFSIVMLVEHRLVTVDLPNLRMVICHMLYIAFLVYQRVHHVCVCVGVVFCMGWLHEVTGDGETHGFSVVRSFKATGLWPP